MSAGASFLISLEQKISGPAKTAASALAELESKIRDETKALAALEAWQKRLQKSGSVDIAEYKKVEGLIGEKKSALAGLTEQFVHLQGSAGDATEQSGFFAEKIASMGGAAAAAVTVFLAVAAAIGAVIVKGAMLALELSGARQAFLASTAAMLGSDAAASALNDQIESLRKKLPLSRAELEGLGTSLANIGLKGDALSKTFETLATVQSVRGVEAAQKLKNVIEESFAKGVFDISGEKLAGSGIAIQDFYAALSKRIGVGNDKIEALLKAGKVSVEDGVGALNDAANAKLGSAAEKLANGPSAVWQKFKDDLAELFTGVDIGPFMAAMKDLLGIFDSQSESGQALKKIITEAFTALFNFLAAIAPYAKALFEGFIEGAAAFWEVLKPIGAALMEVFGLDGSASEDTLETMKTIGQVLAYVLGAVAVLAGIAAIAVLLMLAPFILIGVAVYGVIKAVMWLWDLITGGSSEAADSVDQATDSMGDSFTSMFDGVKDLFDDFDLVEMGSNMIDGLVEGIKAGASAVVDAIIQTVQAAIDGAKWLLEEHSPSKVFERMGGHTAEGFAQGVEGGTADVQGSVKTMLEVPGASAAKGGGAPGTGALGPLVVNVTIEGSANEADVRRGVALGVGDAFEQFGLQAGF